MKILVLNNGYLSSSPSGGDKHLLDMAAAWADEHEVTYVLPEFAAAFLAPGVKRVTYRSRQPRGLIELIATYLCRTVRVAGMVRKYPAELLFVSPGLFDLLPALLHRRRFSSRVAVYVFHIAERKNEPTLLHRIQSAISTLAQSLSLCLVRRADVVFTSATHVQRQLEGRGVSPEQIVIQYPSVNKEGVLRARPLDAPDVLFIGRLVAKKGIFDLVEALKRVEATAGIIGDGEERAELERVIRASQLEDRITVFGPLPEERLYGLLRGCKVFAFPSYEEGYGIAIAEALLAGKQVVAYDLPHYQEVFGDCVVTVPQADVEALAGALNDALVRAERSSGVEPESLAARIYTKHETAEHAISALVAVDSG